MLALNIIYSFIFGCCIGSFINVLLKRFPINESILYRSKCMNCQTVIKWHENIPILSWILLKGKCRNCQINIDPSYIFIELLTGSLFVLSSFSKPVLLAEIPINYHILASWFLLSLSIPLIIFDLKYLWLPKSLNYLAIIIGIFTISIYSMYFESDIFTDRFLALFVSIISLKILCFIFKLLFDKEVIGSGDIKLIGALGIWLGLKGLLLALYLSSILSGLITVLLLFSKKISFGDKIPFGPYLIISGLSVWFLGIDFYFQQYTKLVNIFVI